MAASAKDLQFRELKDTITQLNQSIAAQSELIVSLQKSLEASKLRETESERQNAVLKEQVDYLTKNYLALQVNAVTAKLKDRSTFLMKLNKK